MNIRFLTAFLFLFVFTNSYSQRTPRFLAGVSAGPAFPLGKYASKAIDEPAAGWAQTGISLSVYSSYRLSKHFGITVVADGQENKESASTFENALRTGSPFNLSKVEAHTKSWKIGKLMGGGTVRFPLSKSGKLTLVAEATAGACKSEIPGYSYLIVSDSSEFSAAAKMPGRKLPWTFCYAAKSGIAFRVSRLFSLTGSLSYFGANPQEVVRFFNSSGQLQNQLTLKYSYSSLAVHAGVEIHL